MDISALTDLTDKVVICAGVGAIGEATAKTLASAGATLVCVDIQAARCEQIASALPGHRHVGWEVDLTDHTAVTALVGKTVEMFGRVDIAVHSASMLKHIEVDYIEPDDWDVHFDLNVKSTFYLFRAAANAMRSDKRGGRLIAFTSGCWLYGGQVGRLPYCTTKGAVTTMTRHLARIYGPDGITVNAIAPGLIDTPMMSIGLTAERRRELEEATPLQRFGTPDEIAGVVLFLASRLGSFMSGATVNTSGGFTLY